MLLTELLIPAYRQMLQALSSWLAKAQQQLGSADAETLLTEKLAADMFPLSTQVRFSCLQVHEAIARLRGEDLPESLQALALEGRNAGTTPGTLAEAQARIDQALSALAEVEADALDVDEQRLIAIELPDGAVFELTVQQYARDWALPQFYFHLMAAYSILRSRRIELGKADYVPHMFAYLQSDTAPGN